VTEQAQLEESLRQAKQEAERANQAKNDFLSRMSHELRTPLNAILGFSQLLEMDIENPQQRESVQHIHKAGHHLLELINEVLDISRIETDRLALSLKAVRLSSCLEEVTSLLQPLFSQSGVHLRADSSVQNQYYVLADTQRLKQILLNLLSNAAKYNRKRGTVTVSCETPRPGWLRLNVADTGGGIPADKLGRLFTPFDRLDAERTTVEGTGLGLALSKRLAEAMNGTLGVHSEVGVGSTFWVELPLTRKGTGELTLPEETAWSTENASAQRPTILYIEDNAANVALVRRILSHRHVNLLVASSGEGGLEMARKRNPSLVLLDLGLPDLSGEEVLRQLRSSPATRRTPVVIVSADALPKNIQRLWAAGINEYLTKPLDINRFLTVVDRILETA
jgi:CheY-like chemotaxis protein